MTASKSSPATTHEQLEQTEGDRVPAWVESALASSDYSPVLRATIRRKIASGEIAVDSEADFLTLLERAAEAKPRD